MSDRPAPRVPPILSNKEFGARSVFEPENLLREARRQKRLPETKVPEICILDPDGDIVRALSRAGAARRSAGWACYHTELHEFERDGERFGIIGCAVGASFAVLVAEQLFASGCRLLMSMTSAGQIAARGPLPHFIVIDRALRDEGTSYHYAPPAAYAEAEASLVECVMAALSGSGMPIYRGATWTTDAPFRETAGAIERCRADGVLAVEMEASALYAFAKARGRPVLCIAHVTNQMAVEAGDFEKGEDDGAEASLRMLAVAARAWRKGAPSSPRSARESRVPDGWGAGEPAQVELFSRLAGLGISVETVDYPAHRTVEEGQALRGTMAGCFTKNLLLRDKKGKLFLVVAQEDRAIDLRTLHQRIGASGRLGFAPAEQMREVLGVGPGALTPLALFLDRGAQVTPVIDAGLMAEDRLNFHPLANTRSTAIRPADLMKFIGACGHTPLLVELSRLGDPAEKHPSPAP
jgi:uridine phosphorylase